MITKDFCTETKVVGVTKNNDRGIPIQSLLSSLKEGDRLILIRDYGNQYDENAIKVYASIGERLQHIGYISASLAENISPFLEENPKYDIEGVVHRIIGGVDGKSFGCNITIWIQDPDEPSYEEIHAFAQSYAAKSEPTYNSQPVAESSNTIKSNGYIFMMTFLFGTFTLLIIFTVISLIINNQNSDDTNTSATSESSPHTVQERGIDEHLITLNEYNKLRTGMYRSEVYDIIGSFGKKISETGNAADYSHIEMYSYEGYGNIGANAQLMFINGKLDTMAQYGLESYYGKEYGGENVSETSSENTSFYTPSKSNNSQKVSSSVATSGSIFSVSEKEIPVKISDISFDLNILPPNSIGTVWVEATYTNKSNHTITSVSLTFLCKDTNEKHYLSNFDTVLPMETSPKFDTFGPESEKESDIEFLECSYVVMVNGDRKHVIYDYKLNSYKMY